MAILIEWFCDPRNFNRWKGGRGQTGENKEILCGEVVALLQENGIDYRTKRDVRNRIQYIQTAFKEALEWKNNTGSGVEAQMRSEEQTEEAIAQSIKDLSEDVVDSQESLYSLSSFPLDSANDPSSTEKRPAKKVRYSMEAQLADALLASNAATKEKIAIEAKKLTLEEQKMEEMLAIERRKLELEERKVKKDEMNMKMIFSKFLLKNGFLTKEEIKKKLFSDDDF
ncbi:MAG: hypothetical protein EXX96DRAFT_536196 [Benjaminiella poitrasii]|nr:MAG: hypothetical protein EXX96DRAFT_536196 [Benjaminiella poitrasii]